MKHLAQLLEKLHSPVPMELTTMFRLFLIVHVALFTLKLSWTPADPVRIQLVRGAMIICVFLSIHWRLAPFAILPALVLQLYFLLHGTSIFPETGNHKYLESYLLVLLLICPSRPLDSPHASSQSPSSMTDGTFCHLTQVLALSVYFYAGIQKALGGRWLSGEYLTQRLLAPVDVASANPVNHGLPVFLRRSVDLISQQLNLPSINYPALETASSLDNLPLILPIWATSFLLVVSWLTVFVEILCPSLIFFRCTRRLAIPACILMAIMLGVIANETEFMFTMLGCLLLFYPNHAVRNYSALIAINTLWCFGIHHLDIRIWNL